EERTPEVCMLVNCAGYGKIGSVEEIGYEHNRGMVKLNCQALTDVTYLTLPYIRNRGQIIQLASSAAFVPQPYFTVYAASKSFVLSFSRALKRELKDREITVTAVCPGPVKTAFFDIAQEDTEKKLKRIKMLVMAKPDKVVKKALNDARKGKEKSVYGILMKLFELLCKIVPHNMILKFMS
ncbi:MAG: SDR family NAD(P)-dependent oxidoreductase, partial [Lachnospiraceae bacterium]|nr:SDR family NAD(P)-dependent oxidoreductase [Lachnospiraceae bacterium]